MNFDSAQPSSPQLPRSSASVLPQRFNHSAAPTPRSIQVSALLREVALVEPSIALERLESREDGLSSEEAARRLKEYGPNVVATDTRHTRQRLFLRACRNPLVLLLAFLAT